jgi:general secretion pathway protein N
MILRRKRSKSLWSPTVAGTGWGESTYAEMSWDKSRGAAMRWAVAGLLVGALIGLVAFLPAAWLARAVASATGEKLQLAEARGTIWDGSAVVVLTGGPESRDASALPGRLDWTLRPSGPGLALRARHACCLNGTVTLRVVPGLGTMSVALLPSPGWTGQWPTAWLGGLGTPWNTLQLGGTMKLVSPGLTLVSAQGRWQVQGKADAELNSASSRITTLDSLGSYRLTLSGDAANTGVPRLELTTIEGALQLSGNGTWTPAGVRFRGEARANAADETVLTNLLNIIGRRDGARSVISIG